MRAFARLRSQVGALRDRLLSANQWAIRAFLRVSRSEQQRLSFLVRAHRRKFPVEALAAFPPADAASLCKLAILLRVAVVLRRNRSREAPPLIQGDVRDNRLRLEFPRGFLQAHPLTALDLREEAVYLQATQFRLAFGEQGQPLVQL